MAARAATAMGEEVGHPGGVGEGRGVGGAGAGQYHGGVLRGAGFGKAVGEGLGEQRLRSEGARRGE
ncbi:hypothetical protein GCM10010519_27570 [Streptomyces lactacystinicus]